ncbi:MAG: hypothetical protein LBU32_32255 [Clostridiales bacterium]|jgi:hypothetical protein|nr:hypothetical protein [Clostridiales bacterium]
MLYLNSINNVLYYYIDSYANGEIKTIFKCTYDKASKLGYNLVESLALLDNNLVIIVESSYNSDIYIVMEIDLTGELVSRIELNLNDFLDLNNYYGNQMRDFIRDFYTYKDYLIILSQHNRLCVFKLIDSVYIKIDIPDEFSIPLKFLLNRQNALNNHGILHFVTLDGIIYTLSLDKEITIDKKELIFDNYISHYEPLNMFINKNGDMLLVSSDMNYSDDVHKNLSFFSINELH